MNISSIRRTLSADMSSTKWLQNNEFPIKKVQSSEQLQTLGEEEMNDNKENVAGGAIEDIWSSILSEEKHDETRSGDEPVLYVHPHMKRASSLSEKSLEICTESLGSETGSDGFSYPSDVGEDKEEEEEEKETKSDEFVKVAKYNYYPIYKKCEIGVQKRSCPPPVPSLMTRRDDGINLHMQTSRQDGRLVLEAVSVPCKSCFRASREGGRLLLTFANDDDHQEMSIDNVRGNNAETIKHNWTSEIANATTRPTPTMTMSKLMELASSRSKYTWPRSSNKTVTKSVEEQDENDKVKSARPNIVSHSLPPRPRVSTAAYAAARLNTYEFYWRHSDGLTGTDVQLKQQNNCNDGNNVSTKVIKASPKRMKNKFQLEHNRKEGTQEKLEIVGGLEEGKNREYRGPIVRGCKDPTSSLFFWEPYCIPT